MLTHAREIQNEVKQKREKIFEFFGFKKKKIRRVQLFEHFFTLLLLLQEEEYLSRCCVVASARCSFLSSGRGEDLDRRAV